MGSNLRNFFALLLSATLVACSSDSDTTSESVDAGADLQNGLQSDEITDITDSNDSIINATNYLSLLQAGLDIAQNRLGGETMFLDVSEFATGAGDSTGSVSDQPCVAAGTYDLFSLQSDDPGGVDSSFVSTPLDTYRFTECTSASNSVIAGTYEFSVFFENESESFTASMEVFDATITNVTTPNGQEDITINGTLDRSSDSGTFSSEFNVGNYAITDASGGTLEAVGTGSVESGDFGVIFELNMIFNGSAVLPADPDAPLTLQTQEFEEGTNPSLIVIDGSMVSAGVVTLSAADGSSVRAEASDNAFIANITLSDGSSTTTDSRSWTEIVP